MILVAPSPINKNYIQLVRLFYQCNDDSEYDENFDLKGLDEDGAPGKKRGSQKKPGGPLAKKKKKEAKTTTVAGGKRGRPKIRVSAKTTVTEEESGKGPI